MRIAVCDDEALYRDKLRRLLSEYSLRADMEWTVDAYEDGEPLLAALQQGISYDVLFADIKMQRLDGIALGRALRDMPHPPLLVYVTSHFDFVQIGYEVRAFRYVLKNQMEAELPRVLADIAQALQPETHMFVFTCERETLQVNQGDIIYMESDKRVLTLHTAQQDYRFYGKLDEVEVQLAAFVRCHASYLVNPAWVRGYTRQQVTLTNGTQLPVSRKHADTCVSKLMLA